MSEPNPYDSIPGETAEAYRAFQAFLGLGARRTIRDAYRQLSGKLAARQAPGHWSKWANKNRWLERARSYDSKATEAARERVQASMVSGANKLVLDRQKQIERDLEIGRALQDRALQLARWPISRTRVEKGPDGLPLANPIVMEPLPTADLANAAIIAQRARDIIWAALNEGLAMLQAEPSSASVVASPDVADAAERLIAKTHAALRRELLAVPKEPPGPPPGYEESDEP